MKTVFYYCVRLASVCIFSLFYVSSIQADELRLGIIGLDTMHSTAFTTMINDPQDATMSDVRVVAAYPYGSTRMERNAREIVQFSKEIQGYGVVLVDSIEALLKQVDGVMLLTNDGLLHLEQIKPVIEAGLPIFLDKPIAADFPESVQIYSLAKKHQVPVFSASALRYQSKAQAVRHQNLVGEVLGADGYSPYYEEAQHSDYYWYGIHAVETVYTLMGPGCKRVKRIIGQHSDMIIGEWQDGRIGTVRTDRNGAQFYGGTAYGREGVVNVGPFEGYRPLVEQIVQFFRSKKSPVAAEETLEIYAFMKAAQLSRLNDGAWIELEKVTKGK
ncbi:Gfo/Idh/MocA family protein [Teredinibacter sp. KSP-S5-2]|uniref:Gfo/Idh/MocA family protein n=1 Tax=Teredinibacter sp. KSP-S5-2 TaxID=3034506 RepID=UPI00293465C0|nr:Gfo/Idh/MocA family oxidoreductase [Teredinibacter sp. KSP-S5-2]WNO10024.1 Gfo/Idh/MocA family oxidoreductase [Teredinibacter sp. KSP-S5-2]